MRRGPDAETLPRTMKRTSFVVASIFVLAATTGCKKLIKAAADGGAASSTASAEPKEATPKETGTKLTKKPAAVGQKRSEDTEMQMKLKLKMAGKEMKLDQSETQKKDEEVLEVTNGAITKLKVTYTQDDKTQSENDKPAKAKPSPVNGKTYIVTVKDGKTVVLNDKEKPAPKAEAAHVEHDYHAFGKPDPFTAAIPDRPLKDGEEVPELASAIVAEMLSNQKQGKDDKLTIDSAKVIFKGKDGDNGVFDVSMNLSGGDPQMKIAVPLTGKYSARLSDGWPAALDLSGPVSLVLGEKDKAAGVTGEGTVSLKQTYTYK